MTSRSEYTTINSLAKEMDIPVSTLNFYRVNFEKFLPCTKKGRHKLYKRDESKKIFREIRTLFGENYSREEVEEYLAQHYPQNIDFISHENNDVEVFTPQQKVDNLDLENTEKLKQYLYPILEPIYNQIEEQEKSIEKLHEDKDKLFNDNKRQEDEIKRLLKEKEELEKKLNETQKDVANYQEGLEDLNSKFSENRKYQQELEERVKNTDEKINNIKHNMEERKIPWWKKFFGK